MADKEAMSFSVMQRDMFAALLRRATLHFGSSSVYGRHGSRRLAGCREDVGRQRGRREVVDAL